ALFLGTFREPDVGISQPLQELMGDLRREGTLRRLELGGLDEPEVAELVTELAAEPASAGFVRALHGETEGNPFFIEEVVRHVRETAGDLGAEGALERAGVPEGVREVTARRLRRLAEDARDAMVVAAVIGREFDFDVLEAVAGVQGDALV